jgi:hypothetical protein
MPTNTIRRRELNQLLPEGTIATRAWLIDHGFGRHAIDNLIKSEQLIAVASGVYTRTDAKPAWQGLVYFLQNNVGMNLTIGGLTALDLLGLSHYLPLAAQKTIHLYGTVRLPSWVNEIVTDVRFVWHSERELLGKGTIVEPGQSDPLITYTRLQPWKEGQNDLILSSPERALLEILTDVPTQISFEHANQLMQGMTSLSPRNLQALLEQCKNIKVRRLFFWLAERHHHTWLEKLHPEKIDMGSGKRKLVENGKLDKKYNITIPKFL